MKLRKIISKVLLVAFYLVNMYGCNAHVNVEILEAQVFESTKHSIDYFAPSKVSLVHKSGNIYAGTIYGWSTNGGTKNIPIEVVVDGDKFSWKINQN